jgi:hypothetical protein
VIDSTVETLAFEHTDFGHVQPTTVPGRVMKLICPVPLVNTH